MRKAKKTLLAAACACALVVGSVAGTVAYLTSTATVKNTFTVGKVALTLDEASVNEYGVAYAADDATQDAKDNEGRDLEAKNGEIPRVTSNTYKLLPGHEYVKDPIVHMAAGSEDSWVFVKLENGLVTTSNATIEAASVESGYQSIVDQIGANGWGQLVDDKGDPVPGVYCMSWSEDTGSSNLDLKVFESFKIADDADLSGYANKTITVTAYAIQRDGLGQFQAWSEVSGK